MLKRHLDDVKLPWRWSRAQSSAEQPQSSCIFGSHSVLPWHTRICRNYVFLLLAVPWTPLPHTTDCLWLSAAFIEQVSCKWLQFWPNRRIRTCFKHISQLTRLISGHTRLWGKSRYYRYSQDDDQHEMREHLELEMQRFCSDILTTKVTEASWRFVCERASGLSQGWGRHCEKWSARATLSFPHDCLTATSVTLRIQCEWASNRCSHILCTSWMFQHSDELREAKAECVLPDYWSGVLYAELKEIKKTSFSACPGFILLHLFWLQASCFPTSVLCHSIWIIMSNSQQDSCCYLPSTEWSSFVSCVTFSENFCSESLNEFSLGWRMQDEWYMCLIILKDVPSYPGGATVN